MKSRPSKSCEAIRLRSHLRCNRRSVRTADKLSLSNPTLRAQAMGQAVAILASNLSSHKKKWELMDFSRNPSPHS